MRLNMTLAYNRNHNLGTSKSLPKKLNARHWLIPERLVKSEGFQGYQEENQVARRPERRKQRTTYGWLCLG